jgi:hypothetical protein
MASMTQALKLTSQASLAGLTLLLSLSGFVRSAAAYTAQEAIAAYYEDGYGYCDAQLLSALWSQSSPFDAKLLAGEKILRGRTGQTLGLSPHIEQARADYADQGICSYNSDFTFEDAVALANYWNISLENAKSTLVYKLEHGYLDQAQYAVRLAHAATH